MKIDFTDEDRKKIEVGIRGKFAKVAIKSEGLFKYPTGHYGLDALKYDESILQSLPETVLDSFCGVGNPFSLGQIRPGDSILDIGCGGGVDTMVAAIMVGPAGRVVGVDMSSEMVERARQNLSQTNLNNISFIESSGEDLPLPDQDFDVVISSGVFNLIPDKLKALREVFRVMKPGGRIMMADQVLTGYLAEDVKTRVDGWAG
jgi:SAM-dependent methyltransferase